MKTQTYAESQKGKSFNWFAWLDQQIAEKRDLEKEAENTKSEWYKDFYTKSGMAGNWTTCACGNQCSILDRAEDGEPVDSQLKELGLDFSELIDEGRWVKARTTLEKIEKRSAKLIENKLKNHIKTLKAFGFTVEAPKSK